MRWAVLFLVVALGGCVQDGYTAIHADSMWSDESRADWVLHGNELALMRVETSTGPETPDDYENSGGMIGRRVSVRLGEPMWRRRGGPRPPRRFAFFTWGWMMESDQFSFSPRRRVISEGDTWLEAGREYLALISHGPRDDEWFPLVAMTLGADGRITAEVPRGRPPATAVALRGKTPAEAAEMLAATTSPIADWLRGGGATVVVRAGSRDQGRRIAAGLAALRLRLGEVVTSPEPGARAFARIAFGGSRAKPGLAPGEDGEALAELLRAPRDGSVRVIVAHARAIAEIVGDEAAPGEAIVIPGDATAARVLPDEWATLDSRSP